MEIRSFWWVHRIQRATTPEDRKYYTLCLAAVKDSALPAIPALLRDPRAEVRALGIDVLRYCPSPHAQVLLLNALPDDRDPVLVRAALNLALRPDRMNALPRLREMIQSTSPRTASAGVVAMERLGGPEAKQALLDMLTSSSDPDLLAQVADSLANLEEHAAVAPLIGLLTDRRPITVPPVSYRMAVEAIARLKGDAISKGVDKESLLAATQAPSTIGAAAARSLYLITDQSFGDPTTRPAEEARAIQDCWRAWQEDRERGGNAASFPATRSE